MCSPLYAQETHLALLSLVLWVRALLVEVFECSTKGICQEFLNLCPQSRDQANLLVWWEPPTPTDVLGQAAGGS